MMMAAELFLKGFPDIPISSPPCHLNGFVVIMDRKLKILLYLACWSAMCEMRKFTSRASDQSLLSFKFSAHDKAHYC